MRLYPGLVFGSAFAFGIAFEGSPAGILGAIVLVVTAAASARLIRRDIQSKTSKRLRTAALASLFLLAGAHYVRHAREAAQWIVPPNDGPVRLYGTIEQPGLTTRRNGMESTSWMMRCPGVNSPIRLVSSIRIPGLRGGDSVRLVGRVSPSYRAGTRSASGGTPLTVRVQHPEAIEPSAVAVVWWSAWLGRARQRLYDTLHQVYTPPTIGYVFSLVLGDRRLLDERTQTALVTSGTFHFLAISGLHVALIMSALLRIPAPRSVKLPLRLIVLVGFGVLTGANPPVMRAALLFGLHLACEAGNRFPRALNSLGWTALALLAWDPMSLYDVSFQMSFVAVLSLLTWGQSIARGVIDDDIVRARPRKREPTLLHTRLVRSTGREAWRLLAISVAACVGTSPLSVHYFHRWHPLSPFWSLIAYPLTIVTLLGGVLSLLLGLLSSSMAAPAAALVEWHFELMVLLLDYAALTPGSTVELPPPGGFAVASCYALLFGAPLVGSYRWLLALIICGAAAGGAFVQKERPLAVALPLPEGAATLVREPYGSVLITDAHTVKALGAQRLTQAVIGAGETKVNRLVLLSTSTRGQESWRELRRRLSAEKCFVIAPSYRIPTKKTSVEQRSRHCFVARAAIVRAPLELVSPDAAADATCKRGTGESLTRERLDGVAALWIHHGRAALVPYRLDREHATRLLAQLDRFVIDLLLVRDLSDLGGMALEYCQRLRPRKIVLSRVRSTAAHRFVRWCQRHQIDVEIASTANGVGVDLQSFGNHRHSTH